MYDNESDHLTDALIYLMKRFATGVARGSTDTYRVQGGVRIDVRPEENRSPSRPPSRPRYDQPEYTFKRAGRPPARRQAERVRATRHDAHECERWRVFEDGIHVYDLWLANGRGDLYYANQPTADRFGIRRGAWETLGSDPSDRLERKASALQRGWDRRFRRGRR